jgi:hypothetical protein
MRCRISIPLWALTLACACAAHARPLELGVSSRAGQMWLDSGLRDFRWDTSGQPGWGLEVRARRGNWSAALSGERSHTDQSTGIPGDSSAPRVGWTTLGVHLRRHQPLGAGVDVYGGMQAGRLFLSWDPRHLTVTAPGISQPVDVEFRPVQSWIYGPQLGLQWSATSRFGLEALVEYSRFSLDTAHQAGGSIVEERRSFGSWQWSLGVTVQTGSSP